MAELVKRGAVPVDRLKVCLRRWDLHVVLGGNVESPTAANVEVDPHGLDQRLDFRLDEAGLRRLRDRDLLGQALALRHIEYGEALKERDGLRLIACLGSPLPLVLGNEAVGVYDRRSMLALADITAEAERLPKGEPALG